MRTELFVVIFSIFVTAASAQDVDCSQAATQSDLNTCAANALRDIEAEYAQANETIVRRLAGDDAVLASFLRASEAWVSFRDAECGFVGSLTEGGSIQPMITIECRTRLTLERMEALNRYLACEEGDLSCPVPAE